MSAINDNRAMQIRELGLQAKSLLEKVGTIMGADGHAFSDEELSILAAMDLVGVMLFDITTNKTFVSEQDLAMFAMLSGILRDVKDALASRLRVRGDYQAYMQSGR
ncbi:MAG: hypothetical protein ABFD92_02040 [Planctomycetaceae bacterium]|nr:hypothetical protein [Planctomycetaceae bacterium]